MISDLLKSLTAFRNLADLEAATKTGYIPTIHPQTPRHEELIRLLREAGIQVWTGSR